MEIESERLVEGVEDIIHTFAYFCVSVRKIIASLIGSKSWFLCMNFVLGESQTFIDDL